jgi:hypothetical protein
MKEKDWVERSANNLKESVMQLLGQRAKEVNVLINDTDERKVVLEMLGLLMNSSEIAIKLLDYTSVEGIALLHLYLINLFLSNITDAKRITDILNDTYLREIKQANELIESKRQLLH